MEPRRSLLDREQGFDGHGSSIHGQEFFGLGVSLARLFQLAGQSVDKLGVRMASNGNIKRSVGALYPVASEMTQEEMRFLTTTKDAFPF